MQELKLKLKLRDLRGKKANQIIEDGGVLGNVYGKGAESQAVQGDYRTVLKAVEAAGSQPIELEIEGGKDELALVKKVERSTIGNNIHHVEFQIIHRGEKVATNIPLRPTGEAPAERAGNVVVTLLDNLDIEAIPSKIPEAIEYSIDELTEEGDSVSVSDLKVPEGVELKTEDDQMIVKVDAPRAQVEEEAEENEEGEDGESSESSEETEEKE